MTATYKITGTMLYAEPYTTKAQKNGYLLGIRTEDGSQIQIYTTQPPPEHGSQITATGAITQHTNQGGYMQTTLRNATINDPER